MVEEKISRQLIVTSTEWTDSAHKESQTNCKVDKNGREANCTHVEEMDETVFKDSVTL